MQKNFIEFDLKSKEIQSKVASMDLKEKIFGLETLVQMYGKCNSYQEQLKLFALKTKPILQACLGDIQNFKMKRTVPEFRDFNTILLDFMNRLICDTRFLIEVPGMEKP